MRGPTSYLKFVVNKQPVALVVAKHQQRATVGMCGSCRIYRGRAAVSIYGSPCDDSDVVIDGVVGRSSQKDSQISAASTRGAQLACWKSFV